MKKLVFFVALIPFTLCGCKHQTEAEKSLLNSLTYLQKAEIIGVPNEKALPGLSPYLSKNLIRTLKSANKIEDDYAAQTKESDPGLSEGWNLFFGVYEGPTSFKTLFCRTEGDHAVAVVEFTLKDPNTPEPEIWQRKAYLVKESGHWVIDDLADMPQAKAHESPSLKAQLKTFIQTKGRLVKK